MSSTLVIPPDGTWFDTLRKSFVDVPIDNDNGIATTEFLEAAESLTTLFDLLGSVAFTPVKSDLQGNIRRVRARQLAAPAESETLQALVLNELKAKRHDAAEALLWLTRGLDFTAQGIKQNISSPTEELSTSFRTAYGYTLKPYHNFMVKPIFSAAMSATPYRKDFYARFAKDQGKGLAGMKPWLEALEKRVAIIKEFLDRKEAKW